MLEQVTHIEGLENAFEQAQLLNDTNPGVTQIRFTVKSEEMPFLSAEAGRVITKNFIWITKVMDLGRSELSRRIRDKVLFDETTRKWKILSLGSPRSDIKQYPAQWNAFYRGIQDQIIGTPLMMIFKGDPARAEMYKFRHIDTVEQLAACGDGEIQGLGMGAREDVRRAQEYIKTAKAQAPAMEFNLKLDQKDRQIEQLQSVVSELSERLNQFLSDDEAAPKKRSKAKKETNNDLSAEAGA